MTRAPSRALRVPTTRSLIERLVSSPVLAEVLPTLAPETFAALVRRVGVEDAAELVALATTEQLVEAFDEDVFVNERAGTRERFDGARFGVWLAVLLEAGDDVAARRVAELDLDFVVHALSQLVVVIDDDALRERTEDADPDAVGRLDKVLESALTEEIDGYLLVARSHERWDDALALILALDRDHRALLERILDRLSRITDAHLDDPDALSAVLTEGESLAEDVEAAREERRAQKGHVEPQAARAFLELARGPATEAGRDPLTHAYFRELDRSRMAPRRASAPSRPRLAAGEVHGLEEAVTTLIAEEPPRAGEAVRAHPLLAALRALASSDASLAETRMEEIAYLANVILAGAQRGERRFRPGEATEAALATVALGAMESGGRDPETLAEVLRTRSADLLFRAASERLATRGGRGFLLDRAALEATLAAPKAAKRHAATRASPPRAGTSEREKKRPSEARKGRR